jgi:hypothetical protein
MAAPQNIPAIINKMMNSVSLFELATYVKTPVGD